MYKELLGQIDGGRLSADYAQNVMNTFRAFVRWAWRRKLLPNLPLTIDDADHTFTVHIKEIKPYTTDEITTLLQRASSRTKLYILLGLNCGFTQGDIATLVKSEIDLEAGTITRKRMKTKKSKNVPIVCYPLWKTTNALLQEHCQPSGTLALLNEDGGP